MRVSFDAEKRLDTLERRGIDMLDAVKVFSGPTATWLDDRRDYGEVRRSDRWVSRRSRRVDRLDAARRVSPCDFDEVLPCQGSPPLPPSLP